MPAPNPPLSRPLARLRAPKPTEKPVPVLPDTELKALIGACGARSSPTVATRP